MGDGHRYSDRMLRACSKTLRSYNALIRNTAKSVKKWKDFGNYTSCALCRATVALRAPMTHFCENCPLGVDNKGRTWRKGCVTDTYYDMEKCLTVYFTCPNKAYLPDVREGAKRRRAELVERFELAGLKVKVSEVTRARVPQERSSSSQRDAGSI